MKGLDGDWVFLGEPEHLNLSLNQEKGTNGGPEEREVRFSVFSESLDTNTQNTSHIHVCTDGHVQTCTGKETLALRLLTLAE